MERPSVACPACGGTNLQQLAVKHDRCLKPFSEGDETDPATYYAFQCECGTGFTVTVRQSEAHGQPVTA